ncbi:hypothetical protein AB6A40_007788 [Gnathostoma spinigerum]|uniref:Uncharacterized protein n=1 Tax=Gnathostoma spinigerum TaxID=75299 RepID=A0ABD6EUZ9_9BILA
MGMTESPSAVTKLLSKANTALPVESIRSESLRPVSTPSTEQKKVGENKFVLKGEERVGQSSRKMYDSKELSEAESEAEDAEKLSKTEERRESGDDEEEDEDDDDEKEEEEDIKIDQRRDRSIAKPSGRSAKGQEESAHPEGSEIQKVPEGIGDQEASAQLPIPGSETVSAIPTSSATQGTLQHNHDRANCLGMKLKKDFHLTIFCHLMPRLSESNIGFHDLYWNYDGDKLRKRRIRVSKMFRLIRIENVSLYDSTIISRLIRICLLDTTGKTGVQVVSNVHTIRAQLQRRNKRVWTFISKTDGQHSSIDHSDFFVRSNYSQKDVVMIIEVSVLRMSENAECTETSLGFAVLPIMADESTSCLQNKTYTLVLQEYNIFGSRTSFGQLKTPAKGSVKVKLQVFDIPNQIIGFVDSLPDVLIWNPMFARMAFYYRRLLCETLLKSKTNLMSTELLSDAFLATFPVIADQTDLMDFVRSIWMERKKQLENKENEAVEAANFRDLFMRTAFILYRTVPMPDYCLTNPRALIERSNIFKSLHESLQQRNSELKYLSSIRCKPINIQDYALDIVGSHSLD